MLWYRTCSSRSPMPIHLSRALTYRCVKFVLFALAARPPNASLTLPCLGRMGLPMSFALAVGELLPARSGHVGVCPNLPPAGIDANIMHLLVSLSRNRTLLLYLVQGLLGIPMQPSWASIGIILMGLVTRNTRASAYPLTLTATLNRP